MQSPREILGAIWTGLGAPPRALDGVSLTGADPVLPSSFRVGTAAQVTLALSALAACELHRKRTGSAQSLGVDMRHAAVECHSEHHLRIDGVPVPDHWDPLHGIYPAGDGRLVRLHMNFPHHRAGVLALLDAAPERSAIAHACLNWRGEAFETEATRRGLAVAMVRSFAEWDAHPHFAAIAAEPLVRLTRLGAAPPRARKPGTRPLEGIRVLDLTRVIAGPVAGRALAAHGADTLRLIGPKIPTFEVFDIDSGRGKRSAYLDLGTPQGAETLRGLVGQADVFLQSYRPGALASRGFGPEELARLKPGIVVASLSAYGRSGPWGGKRGFDSLVQTATGFNAAEAAAAGEGEVLPLPIQILDHGTGYLLAFGTIVALMRQMEQGGSWLVETSLARTGAWVRSLGRVEGGLSQPDIAESEIGAFLEESPSGYGKLTAVRHAAQLGLTPARWTRPAMRYGSDQPRWA